MLNVAEMTPAGGGGGTPLPSNIVTGTGTSGDVAIWGTTSTIEGVGGEMNWNPSAGLTIYNGLTATGGVTAYNGLFVESGNVKLPSGMAGILYTVGGFNVAAAYAMPIQFGYAETQWASNGGTIGTIGSSVFTPLLNGVIGTSGGTLNLPSSGAFQGQMLIIKDEGGNALSANIIVSANGTTIDGASTYVLNENYASVTVYWNGSAWFTI